MNWQDWSWVDNTEVNRRLEQVSCWRWASSVNRLDVLRPLFDEVGGDDTDDRIWNEPPAKETDLKRVGFDTEGEFVASARASSGLETITLIVERATTRTVAVSIDRNTLRFERPSVEIAELDDHGRIVRSTSLGAPEAATTRDVWTYRYDPQGRPTVIEREMHSVYDGLEMWRYDLVYRGDETRPLQIGFVSLGPNTGEPTSRRRLSYARATPKQRKAAAALVAARLPDAVLRWIDALSQPPAAVVLAYSAGNPDLPPSLGASFEPQPSPGRAAATTLPADLPVFDPVPGVFADDDLADAMQLLSLSWLRSGSAAQVRKLLLSCVKELDAASRSETNPFVYIADLELDGIKNDLRRRAEVLED